MKIKSLHLAKTYWTTAAGIAGAGLLALSAATARADFIFEHDGHTYKVIESAVSWHSAAATAERMALAGENGYLARVDSAAENAAIFDAVSNRLSAEQVAITTPNDGSGAAFIWLGGTDSDQEGDWRWINNGDAFWYGDFNGSPIGGRYNNWGIQPDDETGIQDALAMGLGEWPEPFYDLGEAGQWNDLDPDTPLFYVIEFDTTVEPINMNLDEPANGSVQSGVGMIRGWAVSSEAIDRVEVHIDGEYAFDIPYGDPRPDVNSKFPENENAGTSGFSVPFRFSGLSEGEHEVAVTIVNRFGQREERKTVFDVARFEQGYVRQQDAPNLAWSYASSQGDTIFVRGVQVGDERYTIELEWQTRSQKFELVKIEKTSP